MGWQLFVDRGGTFTDVVARHADGRVRLAKLLSATEDAVARCTRVVSRDRPDPANRELYDRLFALYRDSQARLAPIDHALHDLVTP